MKLNFQQKLILSFLILFVLFTAGIVIFEQSRARRYKTEALQERLDAYVGEIEQYLLLRGNNAATDSLLQLMPSELRLTLIDRSGAVVYDNAAADHSTMENHAARPEIVSAAAEGTGMDVRTSTSVDRTYLYYAKDHGGPLIVRVALPYDIEVQSFLKPDNAFLYFIVALFLAGLYFIWSVSRYLAGSQRRLQHLEIQEKNRRLKQELTGNIAHELRTPVTSIRGFLEIVLENDLQTLRAQEYLQRAYYQTLTLSELISDMSLLTRLDEKRDAFEFSQVDIAQLLERVRADTASALAEKNISLAVDIPAFLVVRGNENLLYSVFRNLTDNVIAHAGSDVQIRIGSSPAPDGMVRFSFADTGKGIADEHHFERLFERFYRVNEGRTRDTGGSGLGLSIVRNAIVFHGGDISVRSYAPRGLEFFFTLPGK
jgi:signal transduction histidine kinase